MYVLLLKFIHFSKRGHRHWYEIQDASPNKPTASSCPYDLFLVLSKRMSCKSRSYG